MANRILRDVTDSEKVNRLSPNAEVLLYRIFMKADDFGSFHANPKLIRSACLPLKEDIREADITRWLHEMQAAGLILFYEVGERKYLRVCNFGQRLRNMRNAFPHPENDSPQQIAANCSEPPPETKRNETETKRNECETEPLKIEHTLFPGLKISNEMYFKDLPNSSELVRIAQDLKLTVDQVKSRIEDFRPNAEMEYPSFSKFAYHFKKWIGKNPKQSTAVGKSSRALE